VPASLASVIRTTRNRVITVGWFWSTQPALATREFCLWQVGGGYAWWRNWCDDHNPEVNWYTISTTAVRKQLILNKSRHGYDWLSLFSYPHFVVVGEIPTRKIE
jgi:hypothetical protein